MSHCSSFSIGISLLPAMGVQTWNKVCTHSLPFYKISIISLSQTFSIIFLDCSFVVQKTFEIHLSKCACTTCLIQGSQTQHSRKLHSYVYYLVHLYSFPPILFIFTFHMFQAFYCLTFIRDASVDILLSFSFGALKIQLQCTRQLSHSICSAQRCFWFVF